MGPSPPRAGIRWRCEARSRWRPGRGARRPAQRRQADPDEPRHGDPSGDDAAERLARLRGVPRDRDGADVDPAAVVHGEVGDVDSLSGVPERRVRIVRGSSEPPERRATAGPDGWRRRADRSRPPIRSSPDAAVEGSGSAGAPRTGLGSWSGSGCSAARADRSIHLATSGTFHSREVGAALVIYCVTVGVSWAIALREALSYNRPWCEPIITSGTMAQWRNCAIAQRGRLLNTWH